MAPPRCYTVPQICQLLDMPRSTFYLLKRTGQLPCLEECRPRFGRRMRFRADLIDRYCENELVRGPVRLMGRRA
jgi:excisionase family DNA binding protein